MKAGPQTSNIRHRTSKGFALRRTQMDVGGSLILFLSFLLTAPKSFAFTAPGINTYRDIAKWNFDMCYARGFDTNLGGGLYWNTDKLVKNAAVNGPASIAAYLLYQIYGDTNYLAKATNIFSWERGALFVPATG